MKKLLKKTLAFLLAVIMVIGVSPNFTDIDLNITAEAAGVSGYSGYAAAEYAKTWWNGRNTAIWSDYDLWGGDCANFVAQSLYAGGIPMTTSWYFHKRVGMNASGLSTERTETWTLVNKLYKYLIQIGGQAIDAPSASQISIGDVIVYDWNLDGRYDHSAIVVDIIDGTPQIACHYRKYSNGVVVENRDRLTTDWTLGGTLSGIKLIKLYGATCWNNAPSYDAYMVKTSVNLRSGAGTGYTKLTTAGSNYVIHVTETTTVSGKVWGKCKVKGIEGWLCLTGYTNYITHVESIKVSHTMGDWYTVTKATCVDDGLERRDCQKCDYYETQVTTCGGHKAITEATCLNASYCSACGAKVSDALGHNLGSWYYTVTPTCTTGGTRRRDCTRCSYYITEDVNALGHNYQSTVTIPTCTTNGTTTYKCSRCSDSYVDTSEWSAYTTLTSAQLATLPSNTYKSRTEYRYRDKTYTTTTSSSSTATLSGWTWDSCTSAWGDYGSWSAWQDTAVTASDSRQVQTQEVVDTIKYKTVYHYFRYSTAKTGTDGSDKVTSTYGSNYYTYDFDEELTETGSMGNYSRGYRYYYNGTNYITVWKCDTFTTQEEVSRTYKTQYRYRDRSLIYTHKFWKWGSWSSWGTTKYTSSSTRDVETRTTYSVQQAALGHNFSIKEVIPATCYTDGCTRYTCSRCGVTYDTDKVSAYNHHTMGSWYSWTPADAKDGVSYERRDCKTTDGCDYYEVREVGKTTTYTITQTVVEPTCCEQGYTINVVTSDSTGKKVDEYYTDYVDALGHDLSDWYTTVPETCEDDGLERRDCSRCDYYEEQERAALGHVETVIDGYDPTCTQTGLTDGVYCSRCDKILTEQEDIDELGHNDGIWICTNEGYEDFTAETKEECDVLELKCGETLHFELHCTRECRGEVCNELLDEYERVAPDCVYKLVDTVESNCTNNGYNMYECMVCGKTYYDTLDALGHIQGDEYTIEATCTEDGYVMWDCQRKGCDHTEIVEVIDATGHDLVESKVESTCTSGGYTRYDCKNVNNGEDCPYYEVDENAELGHDMTGWYVEKEATCEENGLKVNECKRDGCGYRLEEEIYATGHDYVAGEVVAPTCTEAGYTVYVCQNDASHTYQGDITPELGHIWSDWYTVSEATYDEPGVEKRNCERCGISETRYTELLERPTYTVTFIAPNTDGEYTYDGETYNLIDTVTYSYGTTTIVEPDVPEIDGYIGYWDDYTLNNNNIVVKAVYELKSVDNERNLETKKTAIYEDGVAKITLSAFSESLNAKVSMGATPYDIVLVLDQSKSMDDMMTSTLNRRQVLQQVANEFVEKVYNSAVEYNVDHRIAVVAFSGANSGTGVLTPNSSLIANPTSAQKAAAWVNVKTNKSTVTSAIAALSNKYTGTRADLGLDLASQVLYAVKDDADRKRIVLFITDGEPTGGSDSNGREFSDEIANLAIDEAKQIKNLYGADVYSIGIATDSDPDDVTTKMNKFMHYVSSNYPDAASLTNGGTAALMQNYYVSANEADELDSIFKEIFAQKLSNTISFTKISLFDTVSEYFTLTTEQELALRSSVKAQYGVSDSDIVITRNDDGTTSIRIDNLVPQKVFDNSNVQIGYGVTVEFEVSPNKNALTAGVYNTNTRDAGIENNGVQIEQFEIPNVELDADMAIVEYVIDGVTYSIDQVEIGDTITAPDCDYADWNIADGTTVTSSYTVFEASINKSVKYTTTWYIDGEKTVKYFSPGQEIIAPEVPEKEGYVFAGWTPDVPATMTYYPLTFNAVYVPEHEHIYSATVSGDCLTGVTTTYTCSCGYSYSETQTHECHTYTAKITETIDGTYATISCDVCGIYEEKLINYIAVYDVNENTNHMGLPGNKGNMNANGAMTNVSDNVTTTVIDLTLLEEYITVQTDGTIIVKIPMTEDLLKHKDELIVYRLNEDDSKDDITFTVDETYLTLYLDHFSYYVITTETYKDLDPTYAQAYCAFNGHDYNCVVTAATAKNDSYMTYTCNNCGDVYETTEVEGGCDCTCHTSRFGRIWRWILTLFNTLFGTNMYCCPDMLKRNGTISSIT